MMDKLFDGSDAHLLPGNAELIQRLREYHNTDLEYGGFGVQEAVDAANALEAADKRIAGLKEAASFNFEQYQDAAFLLCAANERLAVARDALTNIYQQTQEGATHALATEALIAIRQEALAQIGGYDAR